MRFSEWLDGERGRLTAVAAAMGVTLGAVSQWRTAGVPLGRMRAIVELSGGAVTLDDLVPPAGTEDASAPAEPAPQEQQGLIPLCRVEEVHAPHSASPDPAGSLPTPAPAAQPALEGGA